MVWLNFLTISVILTGSLVLLKLYIKLKTKWCTSKVCLVGKTVIVTGANTGIGYETALDCAKRGARVILACRDEIRATQARDEIIRLTENKNVTVKLLDLSSFKSVRSFAKDVVEKEERLDVLVNNAGVLYAKDGQTEDGLQILMQVNYFGPVLLTLLLLDILKKSAPSRIVNVSSYLAAFTKLDVNNLNTYAGPYYTYSNSKLCNFLFTMHLSRVLQQRNVTTYSVHPGVVKSDITRDAHGLYKLLVGIGMPFSKTSEEGAQTVIYTAIEQGIEQYSGRYFHECQAITTFRTARNPDLPKKLWEKTVELLKCDEEAKHL